MAGKSVSIGRHRISVRGDELVDEHSPMLGKTKESILPLHAISSIDTTRKQSIKAIVCAALFGLIGFGALAEGAAGFASVFILLAGVCALWWWGTRSYRLVVQSPTGEISVEGKNKHREDLEAFASYLRNQRRRQGTVDRTAPHGGPAV